jgi:hypothetical protein
LTRGRWKASSSPGESAKKLRNDPNLLVFLFEYGAVLFLRRGDGRVLIVLREMSRLDIFERRSSRSYLRHFGWRYRCTQFILLSAHPGTLFACMGDPLTLIKEAA